jgi:hypothetical protein
MHPYSCTYELKDTQKISGLRETKHSVTLQRLDIHTGIFDEKYSKKVKENIN